MKDLIKTMSVSHNIRESIEKIKVNLPQHVTLIAVSKFQPVEKIEQAYYSGVKDFGENYVQEMKEKYEQLPKDIRWHFIGHLQSNKIKYISPFVHLIHGVDNLKLLHEINKHALKNNRIINCLLQIHIAKEETKFGLSYDEAVQILNSNELKTLNNIKIAGLMGMATNTNDLEQIRTEFISLKNFFDKLKQHIKTFNIDISVLSMGMSNDYLLAIECGSNMIRVGTMIFGDRVKNKL